MHTVLGILSRINEISDDVRRYGAMGAFIIGSRKLKEFVMPRSSGKGEIGKGR